MSKRQFWDHSGKPSVFVEVTNGVETYRGPFSGAKKQETEIEALRRERDEARELVRNLYSAACELRRFTAAYASDYDEADGKEGALNAISDFYDASKNIAKILGEEAAK